MAQNYIFSGERLDFTNDTGSAIVSGQALIVGSLPAVAVVDIAEDATGAIALEGVWELPLKEGVDIPDVGAPLYLIEADGTLSDLPEDGPLYGNCATSTAVTDGNVQVLLGGYGESQANAIADLAGGNLTAIPGSFADEAAARTAVNTLATEVETRLDLAEAKINAILAAARALGLIAS